MVLAALSLTAACARDDEPAMRARLDQWFSLGESVGFSSTQECAAGVFRLVDPSIKAAMPVTSGAGEMLLRLGQSGRAALDDRAQPPDAGLVALINRDRATGMQIRRAALEGRACMDDTVESAFRYALEEPRSVLAYDRDSGSLMILDPVTGVLVVSVGAR
ncbi:hypothetical protein [uncultured Roseovarius sp.]|uniref:hypothetical protein n=1 Tax=uncultured Roseovarius sp. TaxID=293344 RepID=UPI002591B71A|nr:hypothetical protein [uncultured Roseovarius sp.]